MYTSSSTSRSPRARTARRTPAVVNAGTIEDQIGRVRLLAEAGVQHAIVGARDFRPLESVERMQRVIAAF